MDPISQRHGDDARMGGMDITISLTPAQAKAVGDDAAMLADWMHSTLHAMTMLRTGRNAAGEVAGPDNWFDAIAALDHRLLPRLEGVRDAVVRAHTDSGGSLGNLALAMDVARSTAQHRRDVLRRSMVSTWENWATAGRRPGDDDQVDGGEFDNEPFDDEQ